MSAIRTEKNNFLMLKLACSKNSFKLCPLVGEKLLFERNFLTTIIDNVKDHERFDHIYSHATAY